MTFDYKNLLENSSDVIWEIDIENKYVYVNAAIEDILGYSKSEIIGKSPFDFMPKDEKHKILKFYNEVKKHKIPFKNVENINLHKDGYEVILQTSGKLILNEHGEVIGCRGVDRDITDKKKKTLKNLELVNDILRETVRRKTQELESVVERYELAQRGTNDGLWDWNLLTNEVYYSSKWKSMLGYADDELENHFSTWKS